MLRKLASQTAVYGISAITCKFLNYLLTPYFTHILTDSVYGEVGLLYSIIPFANVILTMGLATGYFRYAAKCETREQKRTLFSTLCLSISILAILFFVGMSMLAGEFSQLFFETRDLTWVVVCTGALIMVDNMAAIPLAALREQGRAGYYTFVNVTGVVVNVATCIAIYSLYADAVKTGGWVIVANLIASTVQLLLLMPASRRLFTLNISGTLLRSISVYSLPLMVAGLMGTASDLIDRVMLNQMQGLGVQGVYSATAKIAALMVIFRQIYTLGAEPFFLQKFDKRDFLRLNAESLKYFTIGGLFIFLTITLFSDIFGLILGASFRGGMFVIPLMLLANLFTGMLVNLSFWYKVADMTRYAIYVTVIGLSSAIVLNLILIPRLGIEGAAWARAISPLLMIAVSYYLNQKYYPVPYDIRRIGTYFLIALIVYLVGVVDQGFALWVRYSLNILLLLLFILFVIKREKIKLDRLWKR